MARILTIFISMLFSISPRAFSIRSAHQSNEICSRRAPPSSQVSLFPSPPAVPDQLLVEISIDNVEHVFLRLDSASPRTTMPADQLAALGLSEGLHDVWIGSRSSGVHVGPKRILKLDASGTGAVPLPGLPPGTILRGTAGNDLWKGFAIGLDLAAGRLWMVPRDATALGPDCFPHPVGVKAGAAYPAELLNADPREGSVLYTKAVLDPNAGVGDFLIDTGANTVLAQGTYWDKMLPISTASLPADVTDFQGKVIAGKFRLAPALILDDRKLFERQIVWGMVEYPALANEATYYRHPTDGLIGLWVWYRGFTVLDFGEKTPATGPRILFYPYLTHPPSVESDKFTGFGFVVHVDGTVSVVPGTDAQRRGVRDGDLLLGADGPEMQFGPAATIKGAPNEFRTFTFQRGTSRYGVRIVAERLL